jgi:putative glutamine amidotransferase
MQMMNVCQGGTLYQDISREFNNSIKHLNVIENSDQNHIAHDITIEQNSKLYTILGKEKVAVNSVHHQGIAKLGTNIVISATASDGVVEAIEIPTQPFAIGIEWHPERLIKDKVWLKLFEAFVEATRN